MVADLYTWNLLTTPGYCWYNFDAAAYKDTCGALYNWYTINTGKLCPTGWHVPTDADWTTLEDYLIANGYNYDGTTTGNKIAKAMAYITNWTSSPTAGAPGNPDYPAYRNKSGFSALPDGGLINLPFGSQWYALRFSSIGNLAAWWSSTDTISFGINNYNDKLMRGTKPKSAKEPEGLTVRCVKDN